MFLEKVSGEFCKAYFLQVYCSVFLCAVECRSLPPWLYQSVTNHCLRLHKITHIVSKIFNIFRSHIKPLVAHAKIFVQDTLLGSTDSSAGSWVSGNDFLGIDESKLYQSILVIIPNWNILN